jgi:hypothetical protein
LTKQNHHVVEMVACVVVPLAAVCLKVLLLVLLAVLVAVLVAFAAVCLRVLSLVPLAVLVAVLVAAGVPAETPWLWCKNGYGILHYYTYTCYSIWT